jgi:hypothetical protein
VDTVRQYKMIAKARLRESRSLGNDGRGLQQVQHEVAVDGAYKSWSALLGASEQDRQLALCLSGQSQTPFNPASLRFRTERVDADSYDHEGWGAGPGTFERFEFLCPCGAGRVVEEHENTPGFREHDHWLQCARRQTRWAFVPDLGVRNWRLEPMGVPLPIS